MSTNAAAMVFVLVCALALLIAAPFIYFLRRSRRKKEPLAQTITISSLSWKQAAPGLVLVVALFFAYASEFVAPNSWLGMRVGTLEGKFWLFILLWLVLYSVERIVRAAASRRINDGRHR